MLHFSCNCDCFSNANVLYSEKVLYQSNLVKYFNLFFGIFHVKKDIHAHAWTYRHVNFSRLTMVTKWWFSKPKNLCRYHCVMIAFCTFFSL